MSITIHPQAIRPDATAVAVLRGPANVSVIWSLTGAGTLTHASERTDGQGIATALFTPSAADQTAIISAQYAE
jgi:hypothetical protein